MHTYRERCISLGTVNCKDLDLTKDTSKKVQLLEVLLKRNFLIILIQQIVIKSLPCARHCSRGHMSEQNGKINPCPHRTYSLMGT